MKKNIVLFSLFFVFISCACAEEFDNYSGIDNAWDGQKAITNKEFEEAINVLQANQKKKEAKQKKKKIKKISGGGTSLHSGLDPMSEIQAQILLEPENSKDEGQLLNIPVELVIDGNLLEKGFYNIFAEKDEKTGSVYLLFYQSQFFKGKIKAYETTDDFGSDDINFVKYITYDENYIKIVYGSVALNAFAYVRYLDTN